MSKPVPKVVIPFAAIESTFLGRLEAVAPHITTLSHKLSFSLEEDGLHVEVELLPGIVERKA
jgi:hypothetical protein